MTYIARPVLWAALGVAIASLCACNKGTGTAVNPDEKAIRDLDAHWQTAINNKDVGGSAAMYADDGGIYAPGSPPAIGHEAILAVWTNMLQTPSLSLEIQPGKILVADAKDMAIEVGTYSIKLGDASASDAENGKYVVTWLKREGQWKVYTDMFNANNPPMPAPAAVESSAAMPDQSMMPGEASEQGQMQPPQMQPDAASDENATPAPAEPMTAGEQGGPVAPVQQFGPSSPVQNAAPFAAGVQPSPPGAPEPPAGSAPTPVPGSSTSTPPSDSATMPTPSGTSP